MSTIRKFKREMLKNELKTNNISEEFHNRYGSKPNLDKTEMKLIERLKKKIRKIKHKIARSKKIK